MNYTAYAFLTNNDVIAMLEKQHRIQSILLEFLQPGDATLQKTTLLKSRQKVFVCQSPCLQSMSCTNCWFTFLCHVHCLFQL